MLITEIKDGTLYASVTAKSVKHVIHRDVERIKDLQYVANSHFRFALEEKSGRAVSVSGRICGEIIVVDPCMEIQEP